MQFQDKKKVWRTNQTPKVFTSTLYPSFNSVNFVTWNMNGVTAVEETRMSMCETPFRNRFHCNRCFMYLLTLSGMYHSRQSLLLPTHAAAPPAWRTHVHLAHSAVRLFLSSLRDKSCCNQNDLPVPVDRKSLCNI